MKLRIVKGISNIDNHWLEVSTSQAKIIVGFGEDIGTGDIPDHVNPAMEGLTIGNPSYDGVFILRNLENNVLTNFLFKEIPVFLESRIKKQYEVYCDFKKMAQISNIKSMANMSSVKIKDLEMTYFYVDSSNQNTTMLLINDGRKRVLVSGDFRNFDPNSKKNKLDEYLKLIGTVDYWFIDGKYFEKFTGEMLSENEIFTKLRNIVKFYKQVFVIQSETDLAMAKRIYNVALKTKRILIENTFLVNLATIGDGNSPNPMNSKKVYTYNPLMLDNRDFDFRKKYVTHFYIHNANKKMETEKYIMNVNVDMLQDMQVFYKEDVMYDACLILAMSKKWAKDKELEEFIIMMKDLDLDYYELYSLGTVNYELLNNISQKINSKRVTPLKFEPFRGQVSITGLKMMDENEVIEI